MDIKWLNQVDKFVYLGGTVCCDASCSKDIVRRIGSHCHRCSSEFRKNLEGQGQCWNLDSEEGAQTITPGFRDVGCEENCGMYKKGSQAKKLSLVNVGMALSQVKSFFR